MPWYKKQLQALLKKAGEKKESSGDQKQTQTKKTGIQTRMTGKQKRSGFASSNPVAQRNRNRPKTDLY